MKPLLSKMFRAAGKFGELFRSRAALARRAVLRSETRERQAKEAERLDRLRNPRDYQGR